MLEFVSPLMNVIRRARDRGAAILWFALDSRLWSEPALLRGRATAPAPTVPDQQPIETLVVPPLAEPPPTEPTWERP